MDLLKLANKSCALKLYLINLPDVPKDIRKRLIKVLPSEFTSYALQSPYLDKDMVQEIVNLKGTMNIRNYMARINNRRNRDEKPRFK